MSDKEYLHKLCIIRKNLNEFSSNLPFSKSKTYYKIGNFVNYLDNEINYIFNKVEKEDCDYCFILSKIFDFER